MQIVNYICKVNINCSIQINTPIQVFGEAILKLNLNLVSTATGKGPAKGEATRTGVKKRQFLLKYTTGQPVAPKGRMAVQLSNYPAETIETDVLICRRLRSAQNGILNTSFWRVINSGDEEARLRLNLRVDN